jgi:CDP-paratose 2-epimerase
MVRQNGHAYFSGNSKGAADQYVRDYARIYGLRTVVFRQSCVYGERQFGVEDQGWVAHFLIAAAHNRPISIYGDGKQVRDLLNVKDLVSAYSHAWENLDVASGHAFNVGGGANNTLSIWAEFGPFVEELAERKVTVRFSDLRAGDQPVFISDNTKAKTLLGWEPKVEAHAGITQLWEWVTKNRHLFK